MVLSLSPGKPSTHIIIMTGPPTVPGRNLNSGPLGLEECAIVSALTRPDNYMLLMVQYLWGLFPPHCYIDYKIYFMWYLDLKMHSL